MCSSSSPGENPPSKPSLYFVKASHWHQHMTPCWVWKLGEQTLLVYGEACRVKTRHSSSKRSRPRLEPVSDKAESWLCCSLPSQSHHVNSHLTGSITQVWAPGSEPLSISLSSSASWSSLPHLLFCWVWRSLERGCWTAERNSWRRRVADWTPEHCHTPLSTQDNRTK